MVCFHIGDFFNGGTDVSDVESRVVAEVVDIDDDVAVKEISFVGLLDSEDRWD